MLNPHPFMTKWRLGGRLLGPSSIGLGLSVGLFCVWPATAAEVPAYGDVAPILTDNCVSCHVPPPAFHSAFENVEGACERCHANDGPSDKGWPDLSTEAAVQEAVGLGVFRQWIQPGGLMGAEVPAALQPTWPVHLTPEQVTQLTAYADGVSAGRTLDYDPVLLAAYVNTPPVVDGDGSDAVWAAATEHPIDVTPTFYSATSQLLMKAVYTTRNLYIRLQYADSTMSMTRAGSWIWTGTEFQHPPAATENDKQSEDRVAILWNKTIPDFKDRHGCAYKCHGNIPGQSECYTDLVDERADLWHSKAERGLAVLGAGQSETLTVDPNTHEVTAGQISMTGFLDDKHLVWLNGPGFNDEDQGRRGDAGGSTYAHNRNSTKSAPKFMESAPVNYIDAMVLTQAEIDAGEAIVADPDDPAYAGKEAVAAAWDKYAAFQAVIPERVLRLPQGSRGDAKMAGSWSDADGGTWVVEIVRALDTGHPADDVIFDDFNRDYEFGIAIFDNCGRGEVPPGHTTFGDGQYQVLRFATPLPRIVGAGPGQTEGSVALTWEAEAGTHYQVQYSADLVTWTTATTGDLVGDASGSLTWEDAGPPATDPAPAEAGTRFYRIVVPNP